MPHVTIVDVLGFVATILNVAGNLMLAQKRRDGWWVRIFSILFWGAYGVGAGSLPNIANAVIFLVINVYGLAKWKKPARPGLSRAARRNVRGSW